MPENLSPEENQPSDDGKINLPEIINVGENADASDPDETASISGIPTIVQTRLEYKDKTASHLAKLIVWAFCISMGLSFLFASAHYAVQILNQNIKAKEEEQVIDIQDIDINVSLEIFKTVSAVMSGPLGFVLGFYFRESK